jgi:hypothetical protein
MVLRDVVLRLGGLVERAVGVLAAYDKATAPGLGQELGFLIEAV